MIMRIKSELLKLLLIDTISIGSVYVAVSLTTILANLIKEIKKERKDV